jgi:hypothetical protein
VDKFLCSLSPSSRASVKLQLLMTMLRLDNFLLRFFKPYLSALNFVLIFFSRISVKGQYYSKSPLYLGSLQSQSTDFQI